MSCTACRLPVEGIVAPADHLGRCQACAALRKPGMLERIAANAMPSCFTPTRESYVRLAALCIELRGGARN